MGLEGGKSTAGHRHTRVCHLVRPQAAFGNRSRKGWSAGACLSSADLNSFVEAMEAGRKTDEPSKTGTTNVPTIPWQLATRRVTGSNQEMVPCLPRRLYPLSP